MGISEIRETTESCKHCFMCRHACPTFLATKLDSHTPRGYALLLSQIDHGLRSWSEVIVDRFYQCSQCGLCRQDCAYHWAEDEVVRNAREEIVAQGAAPPRVASIAKRVSTTGSPYDEPAPTPKAESATPGAAGAEVLYFAGCSVRQAHPQILGALDKVLGVLGIGWTMLEEEGCCGTPLYELGYTADARKVAEGTAEKIRALKPRRLLLSCPHCYRTLAELYPAWGVGLPPEIQILHVTQYLEPLVQEGTLRLAAQSGNGVVAYHDPCQLGRRMGIFDAPRRLIAAASGGEPLELFHGREMAECCGAGSVMSLTDPSVSYRVAANRLKSARDSGVDLLVTGCQNCKTVLTRASEGDERPKVIDICELIASRISTG